MRQLVRRRNHGFPTFAKVVNDIFNDDFVKNMKLDCCFHNCIQIIFWQTQNRTYVRF